MTIRETSRQDAVKARGRLHLATASAIFLLLSATPGLAQTITYDNFEKSGGYTLSDYQAKWANPYGLGEMGVTDTRNFSAGNLAISASPFQTAFDFGVYDHIKYLGVSTEAFAVPGSGTLTFTSTINSTPLGVEPGRVIDGTYVQSGLPYAEPTLQGQQAAAVMNMIDFTTGQLFDWFVSGNQAFTLIERLPSAVVNPALPPGDPGYVGIDKAYTQIINVIDIGSGPHDFSITYGLSGGAATASYLMDGVLISQVGNVGVPLDKQGVPFDGVYPSYGDGELLADQIHSFSIGHGLFSLLDAFPFQLPDRPDLNVSIPLENRAFGQGIDATFDNFRVTTAVPEPATWAMMIVGFGIVGALARRRALA